jgi:hypothetical protein
MYLGDSRGGHQSPRRHSLDLKRDGIHQPEIALSDEGAGPASLIQNRLESNLGLEKARLLRLDDVPALRDIVGCGYAIKRRSRSFRFRAQHHNQTQRGIIMRLGYVTLNLRCGKGPGQIRAGTVLV